MRRPVIVVYDVGDDGRRAALRERLRYDADRTQQSAWIVAPGRGLAPDVLGRSLAQVLAPGDRLRLYQPCADCLRHAAWAPELPSPLGWWLPQVILAADPYP